MYQIVIWVLLISMMMGKPYHKSGKFFKPKPRKRTIMNKLPPLIKWVNRNNFTNDDKLLINYQTSRQILGSIMWSTKKPTTESDMSTNPTIKPTSQPTIAPTKAPVQTLPTFNGLIFHRPSFHPTRRPSAATNEPTNHPTLQTAMPTNIPTKNTLPPTTAMPTVTTESPTNIPTDNPTVQSMIPTAAPTLKQIGSQCYCKTGSIHADNCICNSGEYVQTITAIYTGTEVADAIIWFHDGFGSTIMCRHYNIKPGKEITCQGSFKDETVIMVNSNEFHMDFCYDNLPTNCSHPIMYQQLSSCNSIYISGYYTNTGSYCDDGYEPCPCTLPPSRSPTSAPSPSPTLPPSLSTLSPSREPTVSFLYMSTESELIVDNNITNTNSNDINSTINMSDDTQAAKNIVADDPLFQIFISVGSIIILCIFLLVCRNKLKTYVDTLEEQREYLKEIHDISVDETAFDDGYGSVLAPYFQSKYNDK